MKTHPLPLGCLLLALAATALARPDSSPWPQFRGPDGQGHVEGKLPTAWGPDKNVAWKTPLPGKGWSSPVVAAGKVWLSTAVAVAGSGVSLRLMAFDLKSGKTAHDIELFTVEKLPNLHARNTGATPTPAVVGDRVVVSFSDGIGCVEAATGKVLWKSDAIKVDYETGAGSSPVPYKDRVILPCDGASAQFIVSLDAATGKELWRTERPVAQTRKAMSERRAFSTPLVVSVGGKDQVVCPGSHCVYSYDADTGKELWRVTYTGFSNVPRPVFVGGLVVISSGFAQHELIAIKPDGQGDVTGTHVVWRFKKAVPNVASPLVVGNRLYLTSDQGVITCLDATNGKSLWSDRVQGCNFSASPLAQGETVYAFSDDGKTILFKAGEAFEQVGRNELPGKVQATPAVVDGSLIVRTDEALYRLGAGK